MRGTLLIVGLAAAAPAAAQTIQLKPVAEARVRFEQVEQDDLADSADALTLRARAGVQASAGAWSGLIEAQGTLALDDDYFDGLHGAPVRPLVADPENVALSRAQLTYRTPVLALTAGRQRIALDDERFVGAIPFRQNGQSFDAVRAEWTPLKGLRADVSYAWSVRTIWGVEGRGARPQAIGGDQVFANLSYASPVGLLTGFAYLVDADEPALQSFRLSSRSLGLRLAGARPLGRGVAASYQLSYARQTDYRRNPNDYAASYFLADLAVDLGGPRLGAGYEVLGADGGAALTSFQTPFGSNFKFQGWADKFLTTPPDGVRDLYGSVGWSWKALGPLSGVTVQAVYHRFGSDRLVRRYGDELDLLAQARIGRGTTASIRFADYRADGFAADTRKLWLQLDWTI